MVPPALGFRSRLVFRFSALPLLLLGRGPASAAPRAEQAHALRPEPSALTAPGGEEPTWEDAEWR